MFEATARFGFFDYFRVPYDVVADSWAPPGYGALRRAGTTGPSLLWPLAPAGPAVAGRPDLAPVAPDDHGDVVLPFDPAEVMWRLWSESYSGGGGVRSALVKLYYAVRPAVPRPLQLAMRRVFSRAQQAPEFPGWPVETALHDLYEWLFALVSDLAGGPVPWLDPWPSGHSWALVLTHDVETGDGVRNIHLLRDVEREVGHPSSWNFVPLRYPTDEAVLAELRAEGCEIGVHGLWHDGRDLGSLRLLRRRLPAIREYAERWGAVGFRSPATQREWEWMPLLGFDYDSSYHDTAPYEPRPGGSCSYLPYFFGPAGLPGHGAGGGPGGGDLVELPITVPMDHTVFQILGHPDATVWLEKVAHLRERSGMALLLTHPDYADDPRVVDGYRLLLETYRDDPTVWRALPHQVAAWWHRRAESTVEGTDDGWAVRGPAAGEARVRFCEPGSPVLAHVASTSTRERDRVPLGAPGDPDRQR